VKARRNNKELLKEEMEFLKKYLSISRVRTSQVAESKFTVLPDKKCCINSI